MGEALPIDPEIERSVSAALAEQALSGKEDLAASLSKTFADVGKSIAKALKEGLGSVDQGVVDVRDELKDVGETVDEKLDAVVGFIVDPIRKGLGAVENELKAGLDPAMGAGLVVGAVYALKDEIWNGFKWLWENWDVALAEGWNLLKTGLKEGWELLKALGPHILDGLIKLGEVTRELASKTWNFLKTEVVPGIVGAVSEVGRYVWDQMPDWLKSGLEAIGGVVAKVGSLAADVGSALLDGLGWFFDKLGLDTLASVMDYLSEVLDAISDWLVGEDDKRKQEEAAAAAKQLTPENIQARGSAAQRAVFAEVTEAGGTPYQAAGLAGLAMAERETETAAAMAAFRGAIEAGASANDAHRMAMVAYNKAYREGRRGAAATPIAGGAGATMASGMGNIVAEQAAELTAARESQKALNKMVALTERSDRERAGEGSMQEALDTVSSSDELGVFPTGRMGGGMVP